MARQRKGTYRIRSDEVRRLQAKLGLNNEALAKKASITTVTLNKWLNGEPAYIKNISRLAVALGGVEPGTLLEGYQPPAKSEPPKPQDFEFMVRFRGSIPSDVDRDEHLFKVQRKICCCVEESGINLNGYATEIDFANKSDKELEKEHWKHVLIQAWSEDGDFIAVAAVIDGCFFNTLLYAHEKQTLDLYQDMMSKDDKELRHGAFGFVLGSQMLPAATMDAKQLTCPAEASPDDYENFDLRLPPGKRIAQIFGMCFNIRYEDWDKMIDEDD